MKRDFIYTQRGLNMVRPSKGRQIGQILSPKKEVKMIGIVKYLSVIPIFFIISGCATTPNNSEYASVNYDYFAQYPSEFRETPNAVLSGSVKGEVGLPLRARITFRGTNIKSIDTGISGKFTIALPSGIYTVTAEADGFRTEERYIVLRPNESKALNFVLRHKNL